MIMMTWMLLIIVYSLYGYEGKINVIIIATVTDNIIIE